jgi:hypothetical protein
MRRFCELLAIFAVVGCAQHGAGPADREAEVAMPFEFWLGKVTRPVFLRHSRKSLAAELGAA